MKKEMAKPKIFFGLFLVALASLQLSTATPVKRQLPPCDHHLRISLPEFFTHCDCTYPNEWGEWETVPGTTRSVATSQCASGEAFTERRRKVAIGGGDCDDLIETRQACMPDAADRLILALGLGGSGRDFSSVQTNQPAPGLQKIRVGTVTQTQHCPRSGRDPQVCHYLTGKRSAGPYAEEEQPLDTDKRNLVAPELAKSVSVNEESIVQFSHEEHAHRFRRQTCDSDDTQHVLFVLDSSGSIGLPDYDRMKNAVAKLAPQFCKKVKFALVSFSSRIHLDFCFNCFENTRSGRNEAAAAIREADYQQEFTRTGDTVRCICNEVLSASCGLGSTPKCLDVVFITDGQSNRGLQVCDEINCLHGRLGVNTYAIGIGDGVNRAELDCISNGSDRLSAFEFEDFDDFERAINTTLYRLAGSIFTAPLSCAALNGDVDPNGGV